MEDNRLMKYRVTPSMNPRLADLIDSVVWNCVEKKLYILINENAEFEAFRWFGTINERYQDVQQSSFADLDRDSILIEFWDQNQEGLGCLKVRNLKLVDHKYSLVAPLYHDITIQYEELEFAVPKIEIDDEWKKPRQ